MFTVVTRDGNGSFREQREDGKRGEKHSWRTHEQPLTTTLPCGWLDCKLCTGSGCRAGAYLFFSRLSTSARPLPPEAREFDLGNHGVNTVTWSPNGHAFAAGGATNQVKIWRTSDGQELTRLVGPTSNAGAWSIAWSPEEHVFRHRLDW